MPISVKTPVYEGPLEVLLELIEKRKLLINDISLAGVCDEYIARVGAMPHLPVGETAEFISLAATLLLIKSRSLLPSLQLSDEESSDIKELEYRLALYQLIKEASLGLSRLDGVYLYEGTPRDLEPLYIPDPSVTTLTMRGAAEVLVDGFPATLILPKVEVKKIISLEEMIDTMAARISKAFKMSFKEFAGTSLSGSGRAERGEVIVGFLALLELVKQGIIKAGQEAHYGDITLEPDSVSTPTYGK